MKSSCFQVAEQSMNKIRVVVWKSDYRDEEP